MSKDANRGRGASRPDALNAMMTDLLLFACPLGPRLAASRCQGLVESVSLCAWTRLADRDLSGQGHAAIVLADVSS